MLSLHTSFIFNGDIHLTNITVSEHILTCEINPVLSKLLSHQNNLSENISIACKMRFAQHWKKLMERPNSALIIGNAMAVVAAKQRLFQRVIFLRKAALMFQRYTVSCRS